MYDPFGCLQGEKISSKIIQEMLQKRNEISLSLKKINRCPSCEEQLVYVVNEFCRECPKCCRVFECDDYEQFQEENRGRRSTATNFHLKKNVLRKLDIKKMFSSSEVDFLGNVIAQFKRMTSKPVNYSCFLYNYFEMVPSECWPNKKEIMKSISHYLPKNLESRWCAKQEFEKWWLKTNQGSYKHFHICLFSDFSPNA